MLYDAFVQSVPELKLNEVELPLEYGCGTAPRRGTNVVRPAQSTTIQSSGVQETSYDLKQRQRLGQLQQLPTEKEALFTESFVEDAMEAHRTLFSPEGKSGVAAEYNRLIKDPDHKTLFEVVNRKYMNNQGTRGSDGLVEYKNNRAITCASIAALFGSCKIIESPPYDKGVPSTFWIKKEVRWFNFTVSSSVFGDYNTDESYGKLGMMPFFNRKSAEKRLKLIKQ